MADTVVAKAVDMLLGLCSPWYKSVISLDIGPYAIYTPRAGACRDLYLVIQPIHIYTPEELIYSQKPVNKNLV